MNNEDKWFEYLKGRLESIETTIRFVIASFIIIIGYVIVQFFKVIDEDIFQALFKGELGYNSYIRPSVILGTIIILLIIMGMVFRAIDSRRMGIKDQIRTFFINNKGNIPVEWKETEEIDSYSSIWGFLFSLKKSKPNRIKLNKKKIK